MKTTISRLGQSLIHNDMILYTFRQIKSESHDSIQVYECRDQHTEYVRTGSECVNS